MMALKILPVLQIIVILCSPSTYAYPAIYGTKRYGRTGIQRSNSFLSSSPPQPYQQMMRTQRYPVNYYEMYPYSQSYPNDYYYPQEAMSYPVYYPRTSKYEVYQAVLPYYYDRPVMRPYYGYDDTSDLDDDVLQDNEHDDTIGQEMFYENDSQNDNINDEKAAFLQNLIMTQMYKDSVDQYSNNNSNNDDVYDEIYGKIDQYPPSNKDFYKDDEEVLELKQLAKPIKQQTDNRISDEERMQYFQMSSNKKPPKKQNRYFEQKRNNMYYESALNERKANPKAVTTVAPEATLAPKRNSRGQKEEVLLRPATPVRHPFASSVINAVNKKDRQHTPSVYDTIKHMLDMEKNLEENVEEIKPAMRKRIVSSDDSLTHQLTVLKKQM